MITTYATEAQLQTLAQKMLDAVSDDIDALIAPHLDDICKNPNHRTDEKEDHLDSHDCSYYDVHEIIMNCAFRRLLPDSI